MSGHSFIFCTHQELFKLRPAWRDPDQPDCTGRMVVIGDTEYEEIWVAVCDECGLEIGIPPRQRKAWLQELGV